MFHVSVCHPSLQIANTSQVKRASACRHRVYSTLLSIVDPHMGKCYLEKGFQKNQVAFTNSNSLVFILDFSIHTGLLYILHEILKNRCTYEKNLDKFNIGHCQTKVKVMVRL